MAKRADGPWRSLGCDQLEDMRVSYRRVDDLDDAITWLSELRATTTKPTSTPQIEPAVA
jgi:hypothetical protein